MRQVLLFLCLAGLPLMAMATVKVPAVFGDGMVLQRDRPVPVWGTAMPGERVTVTFGKQSKVAVAGQDGKWRVALSAMRASDTPRTLTVSGTNTLTFTNVLVGEVWVCSGQSNMGYSLWHVNNAQEEINNANYPGIRMFIVSACQRPVPLDGCQGNWVVCTPRTVGFEGFSAVGYFFAREIHRRLHVPVGMLHSSVGATDAEFWISQDGIKRLPQFQQEAAKAEEVAATFTAKLPSYPDELAKYEQQLAAAITKEREQEEAWHVKVDAGDVGLKEQWSNTNANDATWTPVTFPDDYAHPGLGEYLGTVWCRKQVQIPDAWVGHALELHLGVIDEADDCYVNGQRVGETWYDSAQCWLQRRLYTVPAALVTSHTVTVTMRIVNRFGELGCFGPANEMYLRCPGLDGASVSLAGAWRSQKGIALTTADMPKSLRRPVHPADVGRPPCCLFNGMINPLIPYAIRGAIWYQGENNHARPMQYRELLPGLIASWRHAWGEGDFPFYIVQIANSGKPSANVQPQSCADLRESQALTAQTVPYTGLAVTLDGKAAGHPTDKAIVGLRLALQALKKTYGKRLVADGPTYRKMLVEGDSIRLFFDFADGLQTRETPNATGTALQGFAIAGQDKKFHIAQARIDGHCIVVRSDKVPAPVAVRYAWADNPVCNLYNSTGLPMVSFRTDDWQPKEISVAE